MSTILDEIVFERKKTIEFEKQILSLNKLEKNVELKKNGGYVPQSFVPDNFNAPFLIAEIKRSSPSKGLIRKDFDVASIASNYEQSPFVNAISVLAEDKYFEGSFQNIEIASLKSDKPILLKDFVVDKYQVLRGFCNGASAFLLISSILSDGEIKEFIKLAKNLSMQILFEVHTAEEYRRGLNFGFNLIGINNRDLKIFKTDIVNTISILEEVGKPKYVNVISESGIKTKNDIQLLFKNGADGFLIGETFMKNDDINLAIEELFGNL